MTAEVYSAVKPAAPYRAWVVSILLLLLASALAGDMVQRGSGSWSAGDMIQPEGWEMSFRPPAQFKEVDPSPANFSSSFVFRHETNDGRLVELSFWRLRAEDKSAVHIARIILEKSKSWLSLLLGPPPTRTAGRLGDREALEVHDPRIPMIVRSVVWESGWGYAVAIRVEGAPIDGPLYALFEMTCRSVKFRRAGV